MGQYYLIQSDELYHYGVLNMRWGHRRYQNKDGTLTSAGKKRLRKVKKRLNKDVDEYNKLTRTKSNQLSVEEQKEKILQSRSARELYTHADLFSTNELNSAYQRLVLERNISSLIPKEIKRGEQFIDSFNKWGKKMNEVTTTGINGWNNFAKIYNTKKPKEERLPVIGQNDGEGKKKDRDKDK